MMKYFRRLRLLVGELRDSKCRASGRAKRNLSAILLSVGLASLAAQPTQPITVQPDCSIPINFQTTNTLQWDNRFTSCVNWVVTYASTGFSALSIVVQSAPDNNGIPGTWVTYAGTIKSGVNPNTNTAERATFFGTADPTDFQPWVRINLSSVTGSGKVTGTLLGFKSTTGPAGNSGAAATNVNIAQVAGTNTITGGVAGSMGVGGLAAGGAAVAGNPVLIGGSDGTNARPLTTDARGDLSVISPCTNSVVINTAASGNTSLVAPSGATAIYVCGVSLTAAAAVSVQLQYGTGATCGTGTGNLTGAYGSGIGLLSLALNWATPLATPASQRLCLNLSGAIQVDGTLTYAQQ